MEAIGELVCKLIEHVCVVSNPGEQNQNLACAAPIQHLKLNARLDRDETDSMSRRIALADALCCSPKISARSVHTKRLPTMTSPIKSQTLFFPIRNLLVFG